MAQEEAPGVAERDRVLRAEPVIGLRGGPEISGRFLWREQNANKVQEPRASMEKPPEGGSTFKFDGSKSGGR